MLNIRKASVLTAVIVLLWILAGWRFPLLALTENQILYTFSSEAQVVAAVYGLTISGYIFLRNQQDRLADRDETLIEILDTIQDEQYRFIAFISAVSLASIMAALLAILYEDAGLAAILLTQNAAAALFSASLIWTGLFVVNALRPGNIARASRSIKEEVEKAHAAADEDAGKTGEKPGRLEEFLRNFNGIIRLLDAFARVHLGQHPSVVSSSGSAAPDPSRLQWPKPSIVRAMLAQKVISAMFADEILALIRYRHALIHGQDMTVSPELVDRVWLVRRELERQLNGMIDISDLSGAPPVGHEPPGGPAHPAT